MGNSQESLTRMSGCGPARAGAFNGSLLSYVSKLVSGRIRERVPGSSLTTVATGGEFRALVTVDNLDELIAVQTLLASERQPVDILGFGSNLLVADGDIDRWIIRLGAEFKHIRESGSGVYRLGGAVSLMSLARRVSDVGLSGLEFAAGIPASLGGAVFMNAGAHGAEMCERIVSIQGVLPTGQLGEWRCQELPWRYRFSGLPKGVVITSVEVQLVAGDRDGIREACAKNLAHRRATQPLTQPSAGSVFKNPKPDVPAGKLLEQAGVKGLRRGGAQVSELHANWIVNPDRRAQTADVLGLIQECIARVELQSGIVLEPEVRVWYGDSHVTPESNSKN